MKKHFLAVLACAVVLALASPAFSQEEKTGDIGTGDTENLSYSDGEVAAIDKNLKTMTVKEYDWASDEEKTVVYSLDPDIVVENAPSWTDIAIGSYVDIEYVEEGGKRIAKYIGLYEPEPLEDYEE